MDVFATPKKFSPVMVTEVPPSSDPTFGVTLLTTGGGMTKVKSSAAVSALPPPES